MSANDTLPLTLGVFAMSPVDDAGAVDPDTGPDRATDVHVADATELEPGEDVVEDDLDDGLTRLERRILVFEGRWWKYAGAKETAVRDEFEISSTRYYQVLNALIDTPAAARFDPLVVRRLVRLRDLRRRQRTSPLGGGWPDGQA